MKAAFELAWCNLFQLTQRQPLCYEVADVAFKQPVEVGSVLELESRCVYSDGHDDEEEDGPRYAIVVEAFVFNSRQNSRMLTNTSEFLFRCGASVCRGRRRP